MPAGRQAKRNMQNRSNPNQSRKIRDQDSALIEDINEGRAGGFQDLFIRYRQRLYNFGLRICHDAQDAEDIVQDTFINVFKYLKNFRQETRFKNWLYRIAVTACITKKRRSKYAPEPELPLSSLIQKDDADDLPDTIPDNISGTGPEWANQPLDQLLNKELNDMIRNTVINLPEKYRSVLELRDMEGLTTHETAKMLNITPATVKTRLHRGRLLIREQLKDYSDHAPLS